MEIGDHLPPDAILALKLSGSIFNRTLPLAPRLRNTTLSDCARLAIRTHLSPPDPKPSHLRCILCKAVYPANLFKPSSSPACMPMSLAEDAQQIDVVEMPQRLCSWHVGSLVHIVHTEPGGRNEWVAHMDEMCMHCGALQRWLRCDCNCDSCSFRSVRAYTRYLNNDRECRGYVFWRQAAEGNSGNLSEGGEGQLWVRETCKEPGESEIMEPSRTAFTVTGLLTEAGAMNQKLVIDLPVRFGDQMPEVTTHARVCSVTSRPRTFTFDSI